MIALHNSFNRDILKRHFLYNTKCWLCGRNHADCFHHAVGRGNGDSKCESSILNAVPLNNHICHLPVHGKLRIKENTSILLQKTIRYLLAEGYKFDENAELFLMKYKEYYDM